MYTGAEKDGSSRPNFEGDGRGAAVNRLDSANDVVSHTRGQQRIKDQQILDRGESIR